MGRKKSFKITPKHRRFIQYYFKTGNGTEAAKLAGFTPSYGRELMVEPTILHAIEEAENKAGLSDAFLLKTHMELMRCDERPVRLGALRLGYQVKKKIGSDEAPPPAVLPNVVIRIEGLNGQSITGTKDGRGRRLSPNRTPSVSIQMPNEP